MQNSSSALPLVAILISLVAAGLIAVSGRMPNLRESWTILAAIAKLVVVVAMLPRVLDGEYPQLSLFTIAPGIDLALRADPAGMVFALSASALWLLTSFFSIGYVRGLDEHKQTRYFASFAACLSATIGIAFAQNLFTFFVFYELLTIATYPLVVHKESPAAIAAGRKYLTYLLGGGVVLLLAVAFVHQTAGRLDFVAGGFVAEHLSEPQILLLFVFFFVGFGTKSAILPLHAWLPTAMIAPTPVSALLHAVAVVKAGVFGFARGIGYVIGPDAFQEVGAGAILATLAAVTIVVGSLVAIAQDELKARLAFSTIAHLSYILLGLSVLSVTAWTGGVLHIVYHGLMKITLFFCAGAIYVTAHKERVSQLDGIGRRMPLTMGAFGLASLGLIGVPPMTGFWSKWFLLVGNAEAGQVVFVGTLLLSGLLSAAYLLPIVYRAFFRAPTAADAGASHGEAPAFMLVPLVITAVLALVLGLTNVLRVHELAGTVARAVMGGGP